jgi:GNAT superfamily N-acetyltransferase
MPMSKNPAISVRRYEASDQPQVEWLFSRTPDAGQVAVRPRVIPDDIARIDDHYLSFWVALETLFGDEAVVGITGVVELGAPRGVPEPAFIDGSKRSARLHRVMVAPERWRAGVGSALMRAVIRWCGESGYQSIILETTTRQEAALRFYEGLGFSVIGRSNWHEYELVWHEFALTAPTV